MREQKIAVSEKLNPDRIPCEPFGIKEIPTLNRITLTPSEASPDETLYVDIPKLADKVEPLLSGHPRGIGNWPLNRGWPLNKGSSGIKFWLRENVNLFKYKHALSFLTIVTCNTAITMSSKNHTNPVKNILDKVSTRTI